MFESFFWRLETADLVWLIWQIETLRVLLVGDGVVHSPLFCSYGSSSEGIPHNVLSFSFCCGAEGVEGKEGTHFHVAFYVPSDNYSGTRKGGEYWTCFCSHLEPWWFLWNLVQSFQLPLKLLVIFLLCAICGFAFSKDGEFVLCSALKCSSLAAFVFLIQIFLKKVRYTSLVF